MNWVVVTDATPSELMMVLRQPQGSAFRATLGWMIESRWDIVLPHPGPLPTERENLPPSLVKSCDWICRPIIRKTENARTPSPPAGLSRAPVFSRELPALQAVEPLRIGAGSIRQRHRPAVSRCERQRQPVGGRERDFIFRRIHPAELRGNCKTEAV
jgi:hypothetical protein